MNADIATTKTHLSYVPALDGLRAIAVCAVIAHHYSTVALGGWIGVDIFFVLSGFLITSNLQIEEAARGGASLSRFYMRRCLRLMPAFFAVVFVSSLLIAYHLPQVSNLREKLFYVLTYSYNWARALGFTEEDRILGHMWSLATEEQFYLIWPVLFLTLPKRLRRTFIAGVIFMVAVLRLVHAMSGASHERIYYGFDTHCDGLLLGCFLAVAQSESSRRLASRLVVVPLIALVVIFFSMSAYTNFAHMFGLTIAAIVSGCLLLAALEENIFSKLLSFSPIVFVGKISYGLYLWHLPIFGGQLHIRRPLLIVLSFAVAVLSYYFIERPFLKLKGLFAPKYEGSEPPHAPMR